ncbi:MAG: hypothetical protein GYA51_10265 [Candidatus Methanofastidiosa archaeon]|jgi:hypothetical protein|nr:hypothetical protein [Candidatus Methanofastidiosa archaeon]
MKKILLFLLFLFLISCAPTSKYNKDYQERRGLMLLQPNEMARNKPLKYSKVKAKKQLAKKIKRAERKYKK